MGSQDSLIQFTPSMWNALQFVLKEHFCICRASHGFYSALRCNDVTIYAAS